VSAREELDRLDGMHGPKDYLPWHQRIDDQLDNTVAEINDDRGFAIAEVGAYDAALIVAAVNSLPKHTAALRAVLDLLDEVDSEAAKDQAEGVTSTYLAGANMFAHRIRAAVAEVLQ
jgi:hypothetical protein